MNGDGFIEGGFTSDREISERREIRRLRKSGVSLWQLHVIFDRGAEEVERICKGLGRREREAVEL